MKSVYLPKVFFLPINHSVYAYNLIRKGIYNDVILRELLMPYNVNCKYSQVWAFLKGLYVYPFYLYSEGSVDGFIDCAGIN